MVQSAVVYQNSDNYRTVPSTRYNELLGIGSEQHCRYLWSYMIKGDNWPWRALGNRQSGKRTTTLKDFYLAASMGSDCSVNCYISPNQFFDWRNVKQLATLHANWLEIDINMPEGMARDQKNSLTEQQERMVIDEVFEQLALANVPPPTGYVLSGSGGIHVYWMYESEPAYRRTVSTWREISRRLVSVMRGGEYWHVDAGASNDPARVLRIPGTMHGSTRRRAQFVERQGQQLYTFAELAKLLGVVVIESPTLSVVANSQQPQQPTTPQPIVTEPTKPHNGRHTIGQWWFNVYSHIMQHIRKNPVTEGRRDSTLFITYVALKHMLPDENEAYRRVCEINRTLIGLDQTMVDSYLSTARKTHYKYRKESLAQYLEQQLGMRTDFLFSPNKTIKSVDEIRAAQHESAINTAKARRSKTVRRMFEAITDLIKSNAPISQNAIAAICGRSVRTVRRYWADITTEVIRSRSIYSPPQVLAN